MGGAPDSNWGQQEFVLDLVICNGVEIFLKLPLLLFFFLKNFSMKHTYILNVHKSRVHSFDPILNSPGEGDYRVPEYREWRWILERGEKIPSLGILVRTWNPDPSPHSLANEGVGNEEGPVYAPRCLLNICDNSANHQAMIIEYHQYSSVHSSDPDCQGSCSQRASIWIRVTDPVEASAHKKNDFRES